MTTKIYIEILIGLTSCLFSCNRPSSAGGGNDQSPTVVTPVTITHISTETMADNISLNATSVFQNKSLIKSTVNGYIQQETVSPGQTVRAGQLLFVLKTKEASAIAGEIIDTSLQFKGLVKINAHQNGYVSQLDHQRGDYVMDGEQLCTISDKNSFAFILQVPFELSLYVKTGHPCQIILPDNRRITGEITSKIPAVDPVTQTQQYIIKVSPQLQLPENLVAKIEIAKSVVNQATVLPKNALLTNEDQSEWWVMKMINDSTAVKVPIQKGLETDSEVQIIAPRFLASDSLLTTGNYGLPDTALVSIKQ